MQAFQDRMKAEMKAVNKRIEQDRERVKAAYSNQ